MIESSHTLLLSKGASQLGLHLNEAQIHALLRYLELLQKWNKAYNLTSITDFDKMITHHLLDSLAVIPDIHGQRILDVGTGAGLPGIPLAIALPEKHFTLLDSNGKKVRFLVQIAAELGLRNVQPLQSRVEDYHTEMGFDVIISRAVGEASDLIDKSQTLLCNGGSYVLMKGKYPEDSDIPDSYVFRVKKLQVPGLDAPRHLMIITKEQ